MQDVMVASARTGRPDTPWEYRALIWNFTSRELKARFKGTALGWAWSFIAPLATILIYSVVFSVIIRVQPPPFGDGEPGVYAVWLITGLVCWQFMSQTLMRALTTLLSNGALLRKVYFPSFVPIAAVGLSVGMQSLIEVGLVLAVLIFFGNVGWTWLLLPLWIVLVWTFTTAVSYVLAVANVHWRDLAQIVTLLLQLLFFLSAVIYPISLVPETVGPFPARLLVEVNPFAQLIEVGRELMYELQVPSLASVAYTVGLTLVSLAAARWVYGRWGRDIGEAV